MITKRSVNRKLNDNEILIIWAFTRSFQGSQRAFPMRAKGLCLVVALNGTNSHSPLRSLCKELS
jgi:hypothetical protein